MERPIIYTMLRTIESDCACGTHIRVDTDREDNEFRCPLCGHPMDVEN